MDQTKQESEVFAANVNEWRNSHLGEFVLIKGDQVIGFFPSLDDAFRTGTEKFGLDPFTVRQVVPTDTVNISFFGRSVHA